MKNIYVSIALFALIFNVNAQSTFDDVKYKQVLYRINAGGESIPSHDNTGIQWENDNYTTPSGYSNSIATENKVYLTTDSITYHESVPAGIPQSVFQVERSIGDFSTSRMEWDFPVAAGTPVEIRLYLAEIFFNDPSVRIFNIEIDGIKVEDNLDLYATYGHDVGVLRTYQIISDGNVDIDFIRAKWQPVISGIEIFELQESTGVASTADSKEAHIKVFPNPFADAFTVHAPDMAKVRFTDITGNDLNTLVSKVSNNGLLTFQTTNLPKGIYLIHINENVIRIVKN